MADPIVNYPDNTIFGQRIRDHHDDKVSVAQRAVDMFMADGSSAFIGDGSSTLYVGLELFERKRQAIVWTNHLAIAHEFALWSAIHELPNMELYLAEGEVDYKLMMTYGQKAEDFVRDHSRRAPNIFLSVRCILCDQGPSGFEQNSLQIKQAAVRSRQNIIFLTDYTKLSQPTTLSLPLVYSPSTKWQTILENDNVFIITTSHPDAKTPMNYVQKPNNEVDWYCYHAHKLATTMNTRGKKRFIEIPPKCIQ